MNKIEELQLQLQEAQLELQEAKDRTAFEVRQCELRYASMLKGIAKRYRDTLGLEIEGVEDILEYMPEDIRRAVKERLDRMFLILKD